MRFESVVSANVETRFFRKTWFLRQVVSKDLSYLGTMTWIIFGVSLLFTVYFAFMHPMDLVPMLSPGSTCLLSP